MREPALRLDANSSDQPAFWKRIHENLRSVWTLPSAALTAAQAANGAPIHLLDQRREKTSFRAQAGSTCLHVVIFAVVIYAKLQGLVTMRVLVGADGRVRDVQVTRGIGLGLDENAVHAVRGWQFLPAKDAEGHPAATWITIETVFRLF